MKLSQADETVFTTLFGKEVCDKLSGALNSEDGELSLGAKINGRVISQEDETRLKETLTDAGIEIGYKKIAKSAGLTLESGDKDPLKIVEKVKTGITVELEEKYKGQTPGDELISSQAKTKEWEDKYTKLNDTYEKSQETVGEWEQKYTGLETKIYNQDLNTDIRKSFPDKLKGISPEDALIIARSTFDFDNVEGSRVIKREGKIITDAVGNPDKLDNVMKSFVEEKQWIKGAGMNGSDRGGSGGLPKGMNSDDAMKYIQEAGKDPMSLEGSKMYTELTA